MKRIQIGCSALVLVMATACADAQPHSGRYPIPATFADSLFTATQNLSGPPAGANHWNCTPSQEHPRPVVLLHGIFGNMADNMSGISPFLANNGYCVFAMTYGAEPDSIFGGVHDIRRSALDEFGPFVNRVLQSTHAAQIDVVGHSEGSVMPRYWMRFGDSSTTYGAPKIHTLIGVAPASNGVDLGGLATMLQRQEPWRSMLHNLGSNGCGACEQLLSKSEFFNALNSYELQPGQRFTGPAQPAVNYLMLATSWDNFLVPYQLGFIDHPQFTNTKVQQHCPIDQADHLSIVFDPVAYDLIANTLDPEHPRPVRCVPTQPAFGSVGQD